MCGSILYFIDTTTRRKFLVHVQCTQSPKANFFFKSKNLNAGCVEHEVLNS